MLALVLVILTNWPHATAVEPTERERSLINVLQSDSAAADKAIACKNLAIEGSETCVPELAKLLPNPELSSWARIALEAIPGEAADTALREATQQLEGLLLVGTINSIGVRGDSAAVPVLSNRLADANDQVASAAAVALGLIGDSNATNALRTALKTAPDNIRSAVAEGCILCAEHQLQLGNQELAIELSDEVRSAKVPMQRIVEATRGAILARDEQGIALLIDTLKSPEKKLRQVGLAAAREFPGSKVDQVLADQLDQFPPRTTAWIIQAMADRSGTVVLTAITSASERGDKQVRLSAIDAIQRVGDETCLESLLLVAKDPDADLRQAALETLGRLPGKKVDSKIKSKLADSRGQDYLLLLKLVGERRIVAIEEIIPALEHEDPSVRRAALEALGQTVSLDRLPLLISTLLKPAQPDDTPFAETALKIASIRMPDRDACANQLAAAILKADDDTKTVLLEILAEVGGKQSLKTVSQAAMSSNPRLQDDGSRLLGKWNSADAAESLLALATGKVAQRYQVRGLRGYLGIARKFPMDETERIAMCRQALDVAQRMEEKQLVLDVLKVHPSQPGFLLANEIKRDPSLKDAASTTMLQIAQKIAGNDVDMSALLKEMNLEPVKLEILKAEYGTGKTRKDVTEILRKQARNVTLITLPNKSYNASFDGDPVPGQVKTLVISYRINGKPGTASFEENALILLPMPK